MGIDTEEALEERLWGSRGKSFHLHPVRGETLVFGRLSRTPPPSEESSGCLFYDIIEKRG